MTNYRWHCICEGIADCQDGKDECVCDGLTDYWDVSDESTTMLCLHTGLGFLLKANFDQP